MCPPNPQEISSCLIAFKSVKYIEINTIENMQGLQKAKYKFYSRHKVLHREKYHNFRRLNVAKMSYLQINIQSQSTWQHDLKEVDKLM